MENKEITMYELMGLIKDDKAPKKIKIDNEIYIYKKDYEHADYFIKDSNIELNYNYYVEYNKLNEKVVEILPEESDEWEDIELLKEYAEEDYDRTSIKFNRIVINQLIKNQKYLKERLDNDRED